jgi:hypothetical protein
MVRDGLDGWWRVDGRRDPAAPSRETATTIVGSEPPLIAAHFVYTLAWLLVLLGLPGLHAAQRGGMGRLGLVGFLTAFTGTYLICSDGELRIPRPGIGQTVAGGAGLY